VTGRERFLRTMRFERADRVPYLDEGLRDGVIEKWHEEGLAKDADLAAMFHFDRRERVPVNLDPRPSIRKWPTSRRSLAAYRRRFNPDEPARFPENWESLVAQWRKREHILELALHPGFFLAMGVEDWKRFEEVMYQLGDARELVREMMVIRGEFIAKVIDRVLDEVEIDFASFSEPIGGNDRPIVSPRTYEEVVLPGYRPVIDVLKRHNVSVICLMTYANARVLLPSAIAEGFDCLWACEANLETMDYRAIRRVWPKLRLIGGIDLDALLADERAVEREMRAKVPPLLAQGGYIPIADGRVRANTPLRNYVAYRRLLEEMTTA
jgi:hypothetical protein